MIGFLLPLSFILLAFGQIGRISFIGQEINVYWYEFILGIILTILFFRRGFVPLRKSLAQFWTGFVFVLVLGVTYFFHVTEFTQVQNIVSILYFFRFLFYFLFFIYLLHETQIDKNLEKKVGYSLVGFSIVTILFSFLQYFLYPDLRNLYYLGWDPHEFRVFGTFFDTSIAAAIYGCMTLFYFLENHLFNDKKVRYFLLGSFFLLVILSFSRNVYIGLFATVAYILISRKNIKMLLVTGILMAAVIAIIPKPFGEGVNLLRTSTVTSRSVDQKTAITLWQKSPLFGWGYNRIRYVKEKFQLINPEDESLTHAGASFHSSFLVVLVTTGIVGLISFLAMFLQIGNGERRIQFFLLFLMLVSVFDNVLLHPFVLFLFYSLALFYLNRPFYKSQ